jgi:hypothetical protein
MQVVQPDKFTLALRLRTPLDHGWLHLSWHQAAARLCIGRAPARGDVSEAFTLAQQVRGEWVGVGISTLVFPRLAAFSSINGLQQGLSYNRACQEYSSI